MDFFVGRKKELELLRLAYNNPPSCIAVIKGRRRAGKSRLVEEFAKDKKFFKFSSKAPVTGTTKQDQIDRFCEELEKQLPGVTVPKFTTWGRALNFFEEHIKGGEVIFFDEISWMGHGDYGFVGDLKVWWDLHISGKPNCMLIFCSSISPWIDKNILRSTAFFGRISQTITLEPLSIPESAKFLRKRGCKFTKFETLKILSVTGGIPTYLNLIKPELSAVENIKQLCFSNTGYLVTEFDYIFHDLFNGNGGPSKQILEFVSDGPKDVFEIQKELGLETEKEAQALVDDLVVAGFVDWHQLWKLGTDKVTAAKLFKIKDPYSRFYLKVIEPKLYQIKTGYFDKNSIAEDIPGLATHLGLQFESLLTQDASMIWDALQITPRQLVFCGPFRQYPTKTTKGCQIDYLIHTTNQSLFVCEFKFREGELGPAIIDEVQQKIDKLEFDRDKMIPRPVIFHMSGISESVKQSRYFYKSFNVGDLVDEDIFPV